MAYMLNKVIVRNKLETEITKVRVVFVQSDKGTSIFSYMFNWSKVDVEYGNSVCFKKEISVGDVEVDQEVEVHCELSYARGRRYYWQVYFFYGGRKYKINKNNAMVNLWSQDDGEYVEITIRKEASNIRLDFVMNSGNAYFYAEAV